MNIWNAIVLTAKSKAGFTLFLKWMIPLILCFVLPLFIKDMLIRSVATIFLALVSVDSAQKYGMVVMAVREKSKKTK